MPAIAPGLVLVHSHRPELLRELLVSWTAAHPLDPLESEVALVQSQGVAQWLRLALAAGRERGGQGIAAAWRIELPARFLWGAYRAVLGAEVVPARSALDKEALTWRLMRMLPERLAQPAYAPLARYLHGDERLIKRHQLARRIADLLDQYQVYRADWLADWSAGHDRLRDWRHGVRPLATEEAWQADLWRAVIADVAAGAGEAGDLGRARLHERFMEAARRGADRPRPAGLPRRLVVFGISSLPLQSLEALAALSRWSQVLVCVHNPSDLYWGDIVADQDLLRAAQRGMRSPPGGHPVGRPWGAGDDGASAVHSGVVEADAVDAGAVDGEVGGTGTGLGGAAPAAPSMSAGGGSGHPLLAAWGRQGRDYIGLLEALADDGAAGLAGLAPASRQSIYEDEDDAAPATLLAQLQADVRALRRPEEARAHWAPVDPRDHSIRFHVAYSELREVEILHDQLLAALSADPTLDEREIIAMVPEIERYAPFIEAVFDRHPPGDPHRIAYTLHDRAMVKADPMVAAVAQLLELPRLRFSLSQIRDWLEWPALQARFGISPDDLPLYARWLKDAQVRWGLDAGQRGSLDLPVASERNTWAFGLRRLLLGYANGAAEGWQGIEPVAGIGGNEAGRLGPLIAFIEALAASWRELSTPATPAQWVERLLGLCARMLAPADAAERFSLQQIEQQFVDWAALCADAGLDIELPLDVVREAWLEVQGDRPGGQAFLGRGVSFATLMPMRAIPFRRIHLLGMNDGDFPRQRPPLDFDLMGHDHRPGDRSRREDDRYLFLEALLSAREHLYVSWVGRSAQDGREMPASVMVAQLRDHLREVWRLDPSLCPPGAASAGDALVEALTTEHPLQAFSRRYFVNPTPLFSHAEDWRAGWAALAAGGEVGADPHGSLQDLARLLPLARPNRPPVWSLSQVSRFLRDPARYFFKHRLGVDFERAPEAEDDAERFTLGSLEGWSLDADLIADQLAVRRAGGDPELALKRWLAREHRRGVLPEAALTGPIIARFQGVIEEISEGLDKYQVPAEDLLPGMTVDLPLGPVRVEDVVNGLQVTGGGEWMRVAVNPRSLFKTQPKGHRFDQLLGDWVIHLAAHVADRPMTSVIIGKNGTAQFDPLDRADAANAWADLGLALDQALEHPLPVAILAGEAWVGRKGQAGADRSRPPGDTAAMEARQVYEGGGHDQTRGERWDSPALARAFPDFDALWAAGAFDDWARRLLGPLNAALHRVQKAGRSGGKANT